MKSRSFLRAGRLFGSLAPIFRPPFEGLWLAVLLYFAWCYCVYPNSQILRGNFPDPDDYMYLVQVMDWVKGDASWYDNIQHRINPPDGVMIHFSRLAMIPMAWMVLLFERLGLGPRGGSMLMALIYPLILLGGFLLTLRRLGAILIPKDWAGMTAYTALFATPLMYMFQPGHVDHHGLVIWVVAGALLCALRMMENPDDTRWGLGAGILLALSLTLALEILPWLVIISGWLGLWAVIKGRAAARNGLAFALALHIASILFLLLTRRPAAFFTIDLLTYSVVYVFLTGGIAVSFAAAAVVAETGLPVRVTVSAVMAGLCGFLFFHRFPELVAGPYGAMDAELQDIILGVVSEAQPLIDRFTNPFLLGAYLSSTALAIAAGFYFFWRASKQGRWLWGLLLVLLVAAFLLTTFYQCRYGGTMGMLAVVPLAALLQRGWIRIGVSLEGRKKVFAEIGLLLLVGPLPAIFLPALVDGRSFNTGILLFPVTSADESDPCDTFVLEQVLRDSIHLGDHPRLIMNEMGLGPELLFRTPDSVLAAPFLDTEGNMDAYRFFSTPYPEEARNIAYRRHVDLVVSCKLIPASYLRTNIAEADSVVAKDFSPHFIELLVAGRWPNWLRPVTIPALKNYVIYQVVPPKEETKKPSATSSAPAR